MTNNFVIDHSSNLTIEESVTQSLCITIDSPRALTVFLLLKYQEYGQLVDLSIDAADYQDHSNFADDYLVTSVLQKSANLPLEIDREQAAIDSFYESEKRCKCFNDRVIDRDLHPDVDRVRRTLVRMIGDLDNEALSFMSNRFRFGPGATTGVKGRGSVLSDKYDDNIHLTPELIPFYKAMLGERWWEHQREPIVVEGSKFTTVPKNAKTDRGIAIEPTLNIYGQLGVGAYLRKRLRLFDIDLNSQEKNRELARRSYSERLATIDLKAASDSISWGLVLELLPQPWFELLELFRSSKTVVGGETIELEKFSSMGNGYTFELESLIFAAVVRTCVPRDKLDLTTVYGDDIIVPQQYADEVVNCLEALGFQVNHTKSFLAGTFFESCGQDFHYGKPVRPFYLRKSKNKSIPYTLQIANALRCYANMRNAGFGCDIRFRQLWVALYKSSPEVWKKCKGPSSLGDTCFIVSRQEARAHQAKNSLQGWTVHHMFAKPINRRKSTIGLLLMMLARAVTPTVTYGREPRRGYLGMYRPKMTIVFSWSEEFRWV